MESHLRLQPMNLYWLQISDQYLFVFFCHVAFTLKIKLFDIVNIELFTEYFIILHHSVFIV